MRFRRRPKVLTATEGDVIHRTREDHASPLLAVQVRPRLSRVDCPSYSKWLLETSTLAQLMPLKAGASMPLCARLVRDAGHLLEAEGALAATSTKDEKQRKPPHGFRRFDLSLNIRATGSCSSTRSCRPCSRYHSANLSRQPKRNLASTQPTVILRSDKSRLQI